MTDWCIGLAEHERMRILEIVEALCAAQEKRRSVAEPGARRSVPTPITGIDIDGREHSARFTRLEDGIRMTLHTSACRPRRVLSITDTRPSVRPGGSGWNETFPLLSAWREGLAAATSPSALEADRQNSLRLAGILAAALVGVGLPGGGAQLWQPRRGPGLLIMVSLNDPPDELCYFGSRQGAEVVGDISPALQALFTEGFGRVAHVLPDAFGNKARRGTERPVSITIGRHPTIRADLPDGPVDRLRMLAKLPILPADAVLIARAAPWDSPSS